MGDWSFRTLVGVASQKAWQPGILILRQLISLSLDRLLQSRLLSLSKLRMWSLHADLCLLHLVLNTELMTGRGVGLTPLMTAFLKMSLRLRDQMPLPPGLWCILSPQLCSMNLFHITVKGIVFTLIKCCQIEGNSVYSSLFSMWHTDKLRGQLADTLWEGGVWGDG